MHIRFSELVERARRPAAGIRATGRYALQSVAQAPLALVMVGALVTFSAAGDPETRVAGVPSTDPKTVGALSLQVTALEARIKKLEGGLRDVQQSLKKADVSDDGSESKDSGSGKGGSGGQAAGPAAPSAGNKPSSSGDGDTGTLKDVFPTMTLRAPFVVVDASGKPIFRVNDPHSKSGKSTGDRGVYIYGDAGSANFALTTVYSGGKLFVQTDAGADSVSLGAINQGAGIKVRAETKTRAYIGVDTQRRGMIGVYTGDNEQPIAALQATDANKGLVAVFNSGTPVAFLSQSGAHPGGGNVTTTDPGGGGVFSAGYDGSGGAACVNHNQAMHCLGIGLPGAGQ